MAKNPNSSEYWSADQHRLARAVYDAAKAESAYAPVDRPPGPGNFLIRSIPARFLVTGGAGSIPHSVAVEAMRARDGGSDVNRFTGKVKPAVGMPNITPLSRGGLYLSEDIRGQMAELYHYADANLTRDRFGHAQLHKVVEPRGFAVFRPVDELDTVNLTGDTVESRRFLDKLQVQTPVKTTLGVCGYDSLLKAVLDPENNAAGRGLALGLATNPGLAGIQVPSARDYQTEVGGMERMQTGNNVVLFVQDGQTAEDMLRVMSVHLIKKNVDDSLIIEHYQPESTGGPLKLVSSNPVPL